MLWYVAQVHVMYSPLRNMCVITWRRRHMRSSDVFPLSLCLCVCSWLSALESTKWLQHLSLLLKAALLVVNAVDRDHRPVLVHCSDGWDRTPQIVALSKLLLDPYYRTIEVQMKTLLLSVPSLNTAFVTNFKCLC